MIDTHTHLYSRQYEEGGDEVVRRAVENGVGRMVFPAVDPETTPALLELAAKWPDRTAVAIGLHPTELGDDWEARLADVVRQVDLSGQKPVAVGEAGIDLYWDKTTLPQQRAAFARQLEMAAARDLPVIIHSRDARDETLEVLEAHKRAHKGELPPLIFHSFTGNADDVRAIREVCDPWFGINGVVTFKNAPALREALPVIGLERILLETDSPYLAPVPHRGKRNESAYLGAVRDTVAATLGVTPEEVETATDRSAEELFFKT